MNELEMLIGAEVADDEKSSESGNNQGASDIHDDQIEIEIDFEPEEYAKKPFVPIVEDDIPDPLSMETPLKEAFETIGIEAKVEPESETEINLEDATDSIPFDDNSSRSNQDNLHDQKNEGHNGNISADAGRAERPKAMNQPVSAPQQLASVAAGSVFGLGALVKSALGHDRNVMKQRISNRAESNYNNNIDKILNAYTKASNAIDNLADSNAALVRDQYKQNGKQPPKSVMMQLADEEEFITEQKNLKKALSKIDIYSKKLGPAASSAGLGVDVAENFLHDRNNELAKRSEKITDLYDSEGNSIVDTVKNAIEKVKQIVNTLLSRFGVGESQIPEQNV